jgi:hypothetical protein
MLDIHEAHVGAAALRAVDEDHRVLDPFEGDDAPERHALLALVLVHLFCG